MGLLTPCRRAPPSTLPSPLCSAASKSRWLPRLTRRPPRSEYLLRPLLIVALQTPLPVGPAPRSNSFFCPCCPCRTAKKVRRGVWVAAAAVARDASLVLCGAGPHSCSQPLCVLAGGGEAQPRRPQADFQGAARLVLTTAGFHSPPLCDGALVVIHPRRRGRSSVLGSAACCWQPSGRRRRRAQQHLAPTCTALLWPAAPPCRRRPTRFTSTRC